MANTTNFGWETPDDTDLVKDGAAAMRTLGNAIDTSFVDLKGGTSGQILSKASNTDLDYTWISPNPGDITAVTAGTGLSGGGTSGDVTLSLNTAYAIPPTIVDAKGDLIAATAADTVSRLAVGTNGQVLTADSAEATGIKWASPSSSLSSFSLISSSALSGSSTVTISGLSSYNNLFVIVSRASTSGSAPALQMRFNTDSTSNYYNQYIKASKNAGSEYDYGMPQDAISFGVPTAATDEAGGSVMIYGSKSATIKPFMGFGGGYGTSSIQRIIGGYYNTTSAISSVSIITSSGTFDAGNIYVYGSAV